MHGQAPTNVVFRQNPISWADPIAEMSESILDELTVTAFEGSRRVGQTSLIRPDIGITSGEAIVSQVYLLRGGLHQNARLGVMGISLDVILRKFQVAGRAGNYDLAAPFPFGVALDRAMLKPAGMNFNRRAIRPQEHPGTVVDMDAAGFDQVVTVPRADGNSISILFEHSVPYRDVVGTHAEKKAGVLIACTSAVIDQAVGAARARMDAVSTVSGELALPYHDISAHLETDAFAVVVVLSYAGDLGRG